MLLAEHLFIFFFTYIIIICIEAVSMSEYDHLDHEQGLHLFYQGTFSNFAAAAFYDPAFFSGLDCVAPFRQADGCVRFVHVEQYMHACKAVVFNDAKILNDIMEENHPRGSKQLGRKVANYREEILKDDLLNFT